MAMPGKPRSRKTFTGADSRADAFVRPLSAELLRFVNLEAQFFPKI